MRYIICNPRGIPLDCFFPNDLSGYTQLHHSQKRYIIFGDIEEAEQYINYIQTRGNTKSKSASFKLTIRVDQGQ